MKWKRILNGIQSLRNASVAVSIGETPPSVISPKSFFDIPGPKPIPIFGNKHRYFPFIGEYDMLKFHVCQRKKYEQFGSIVLEKGLGDNEAILSIYDPDDFMMVLRNEGPFPERPSFKAMEKVRREQPEDFPSGGLIIDKGQQWQEVRSGSQKVTMRRKAVGEMMPAIDEVVKDLVTRIGQVKDSSGKIDNMQLFMAKWGFESVVYLLSNKRLGLLSDKPSVSNAEDLLRSLESFWQLTQELDYGLPHWHVFPRLSKKFQVFKKDHNNFFEGIVELIKESQKTRSSDTEPTCLMDRLLKTLSPQNAYVFAIDFLYTGVDTTYNAFLRLLRDVADRPEVQAKILQESHEVLGNKEEITGELLDRMSYLKACLKESLRMLPIQQGPVRRIAKDMVLSGYHVPAGTVIIFNMFIPALDQRYFPEPQLFCPERWIKGTKENEELGARHPFAMHPFGTGVRKCIGQVVAEHEIYTLIVRLLDKFQVQYTSTEPFDLRSYFIWFIHGDLHFKFTERNAVTN